VSVFPFSPPLPPSLLPPSLPQPLTPLGLLYQAKLREFLRSPSSLYHPHRLLPALQPFLPRAFLVEHALLLARLGQHRDVLRTYAVELNNPSLAEEYCEEVYRRKGGREGGSGGGRGEVYLDLVRVYLQQEEEDKKEGGRAGGKEANTPRWLACLERNFDKIDAGKTLPSHPPSLPPSLPPFLFSSPPFPPPIPSGSSLPPSSPCHHPSLPLSLPHPRPPALCNRAPT